MMKKPGLKITSQMILGFALILGCIVVLGVIALRQSSQIARQTDDLYNHPLAVRRALGELKADILMMHRDTKDLFMVEGEEKISRILQSVEGSRTDALRQFDVLYERFLGDRTDLDRAFDDFARWDVIRAETLRLLREGSRSEAMERTSSNGEGGSHVAILLDHLRRVEDFSRQKADQFYTDSEALSRELFRQLGLLVTGTLLLSLVIILVLFRNIRRPLLELNVATQGYLAGNHDLRCAYRSSDEFGQLAASFNELAGAVQSELDLRARAASLTSVMLQADDARHFCRSLLATLFEHTGAQLGAVYVLNDQKTAFDHFESIGMDADRCGSFSTLRYEGEFGPALATGKIQQITDIPEDTRWALKTPAGMIMPRSIITVPLAVGGEIQAMVSLASVSSFSAGSLRLLETIAGLLSARMDGILAYNRLEDFSHRLENQNRELEAQTNELSNQTRELTEQNIELELQKRQLDEANRLKSSFLSTMSHELRTPLNSVIALSGVLGRKLEGKVPAEEYSYLDVIERNGKHLLELINDILDLSRIEAGREELTLERFEAGTLIREVVELIGPLADQKGISLEVAPGTDLPEMLSDYEKCRHILQNLVANAVKFTDQGNVTISAVTDGGKLRITVEDTGIGIEEKNQALIFEEFRQADDSASRKYGGTGLGLAIARKYAELLGGSISVHSVLGTGSCFTVALPLITESGYLLDGIGLPSRTARETLVAPHLPVIQTPEARRKTILLVEDTPAIVIQLEDMLTAQGYTIMVARDGGEALEKIEQQVPDGMILDLMMPRVDGFQVLKWIREQEKSERLPVVILTAKYVTKEELDFLKHNNVQQLIQKGDINKSQLLDAVARMVFPSEDELSQKALVDYTGER